MSEFKTFWEKLCGFTRIFNPLGADVNAEEVYNEAYQKAKKPEETIEDELSAAK